MLFFNFLVGCVLALAAIVTAVPVFEDSLQPFNITVPGLNESLSNVANTLGYDPSFYYHDYSMVQAWMGKKKVQVGTLTGSDLFKEAVRALDKSCPDTSNGNEGHCFTSTQNEVYGEIRSTCQKPDGRGTTDCVFNLYQINAQWQTGNIRNLLIDAVAGALAAVTIVDGTHRSNCFWLGGKHFCNVGDVVRVSRFPVKVNFPSWSDKEPNYMWIHTWNYWTGYGNYDCCDGDGLKRMDDAIGGLKDSIREKFKSQQKDWFLDSRCIIDGWKTC